MTWSNPPFPELTKQMAQLGAVFKTTTPGLQLFNLKMKATGAAFGPFQDFFVKGKQAVDLFGEVLGVTSESVEETNKTMTTFNETIETTMTIFGGIVKDVLILIGIFMAAVGVVAILAGSFANMNAVVPGSGDAFEMVKEAGALLWEQMQQLIAAFDGVGVSGETVKEALATIAGAAMTFLGVVISVYAAIATGYLQVLNLLADAGIFSTIIEGAMMLYGTIVETVGGVMEQLGVVGDGSMGLVEVVRAVIDSIVGFIANSGILPLLNEILSFAFEGISAVIVVVGFLVRAVIAFFQATAPVWNSLISLVMVGFDMVVGTLQLFFRFWSSVFKLITGDVDGFKEGILSLAICSWKCSTTSWGRLRTSQKTRLRWFSPFSTHWRKSVISSGELSAALETKWEGSSGSARAVSPRGQPQAIRSICTAPKPWSPCPMVAASPLN